MLLGLEKSVRTFTHPLTKAAFKPCFSHSTKDSKGLVQTFNGSFFKKHYNNSLLKCSFGLGAAFKICYMVILTRATKKTRCSLSSYSDLHSCFKRHPYKFLLTRFRSDSFSHSNKILLEQLSSLVTWTNHSTQDLHPFQKML
jgi:hypothetical protein